MQVGRYHLDQDTKSLRVDTKCCFMMDETHEKSQGEQNLFGPEPTLGSENASVTQCLEVFTVHDFGKILLPGFFWVVALQCAHADFEMSNRESPSISKVVSNSRLHTPDAYHMRISRGLLESKLLVHLFLHPIPMVDGVNY